MLTIRNQQVLLDRDVAALYGVETKALNQAVKRNAERFDEGYIFQLDTHELENWKSQIVTSNLSKEEIAGLKMGLRRAPYAFTERGLYMLATVLNSDRAVHATKAIIETYAQVRSMVRDMEALQAEKAGSPEQANMLTRAGHKLAELIGDNLSTVSRKTTIELNRYLGEWYEIARLDHSFERGYDTDKLIWVRQEMYESDVADKVLAAHFPFKTSNLRLTMSRRFGIIESF